MDQINCYKNCKNQIDCILHYKNIETKLIVTPKRKNQNSIFANNYLVVLKSSIIQLISLQPINIKKIKRIV